MVDEELSPAVMRKTVHLGTKLGSFESAQDSVAETLEVQLTTKRVERLTERIGRERVAERQQAIADWESLPLVEKLAAPKGIKAPAVACVSCDGGRMQRCDLPEEAKSHWCETKVGALLELEANPHDADPCPQVPDTFLDLGRMEQVTREIHGAVPKGQTFVSVDKSDPPTPVDSTSVNSTSTDSTSTDSTSTDSTSTDSTSTDSTSIDSTSTDSTSADSPPPKPSEKKPSRRKTSRRKPTSPPNTPSLDVVAAAREAIIAEPPVVLNRDVVASLTKAESFGKHLAAHAWSLGFAAAILKVFIADGSSTNWGIWRREFKHLEFVPVLDFIHALTYVYSAAMAGRSHEEGGPIYARWITWVWQGEVTRVIAELAARAVELGSPPPNASETYPRQILANTITYLTNQQSRMNYPTYRKMGLPITSSHIESTVKQVSRRVKGSEKFWTEQGGEALLQLRADQLCDTAPLDTYWQHRPQNATGTRNYKSPTQAAA